MNQPAAHPNVRAYLAVFGTLMFLTVVTVAVSRLGLPGKSAVAAGVAIASLKAGLVAAFFMHLKGERALIYGFLGLTAFFVAMLLLWPIADAALRRDSAVRSVPAPTAAERDP